MKEYFVSVIIPTYQRTNMLGGAIESVLNQNYNSVEVIVVDDNDSESNYRKETELFMQRYDGNEKVKYITPVPGGVGQMTVAMLAKNIMKSYEIQNGNHE